MENAGYLFAAFAIIWGAVFGYVISMYLKQKKLLRDIDSLKEVIRERNER